VHVCIVPRLAVKVELMHDPRLVLEPQGHPTRLEHQHLLHANQLTATSITSRNWFEDLPVLAGGLLISLLGGPVGVHPSLICRVFVAEEIPLLLPHLHLALFISTVTTISTEC
jgi:hypothetical protein